jgi:prepilin-type N-terminal cleavage/methylation domain-containing protein
MPTALKIRAFRIAQRLRRAFNPKHRAHRAFTLPELRGRSRAFTLKPRGRCAFRSPKLRGRSTRPRRAVAFSEGGFTLLELLAVMAMILLALAALVPAVTSLSKSSGRKAAISNLLGAIEQARAQAITDGQATYIVFPAQLPGSPDPATIQRYSYRSYAVFEDDPANPGTVKQLTGWRRLPTGVSLRSGDLGALATSTPFAFTPLNTTANFPFLKFNTNGEVDPISTPSPSSSPVPLGIFEGYVDGTGDKDTNSSKFTETITVGRLTGRAEYTP